MIFSRGIWQLHPGLGADPGLEGALANVIGQLSKIGEIVCATGEDATTQDAHQKYCPLFAQALIGLPQLR